MKIAMIQDKLVDVKDLPPAYLDRGVFFGDGVYEVVRSYNGKIFALDEHLKRFERSLTEIKISGVDIGQIRSRVLKAFEAAGIADAKIYFHITRGSAPRDHNWDEATLKPNFFLTVSDLSYVTEQKKNGVAVSTYPDLRWKRCDIKSLNLLPNVLARRDAWQKGCSEALLVDNDGLITEGAGSAVFAIFGQTVQTAPLTANILGSITRKFAMRAANDIGLLILEKSMTTEQAKLADELFIAVTTKDIVGVVTFDGEVTGDGKVGELTRQIDEQFQTFTV